MTILVGLPGLYLAWAAYRDAGRAEEANGEKEAHGRPIEQWEPVDLGVHEVIGRGPTPPYVLRPHDDLLRAVLNPSATTSRLIVVRGGASTGKSRAAYEAVLDRLAGWRVDYPLTAAALAQRLGAGIGRRTVLWLGELRYYADSDGGPMALGRLADLLDGDGQVVAITTLWPEDWRKYTATALRSEHSGADPAGVTGRLLVRLPELADQDVAAVDPRRGGVVDVPTRFTDDEMVRANHVRDPVLAEAVGAARAGGSEGLVTQYLAGAPSLLQQYDGPGADPYGRAVITAAMDAARLGHSSPCPPGLLREAAVGYLTDRQRTTDIGRWWDKALAYATEEIKGVVQALEPVPPPQGTGVAGFRCADYLDLYGRRTRQDRLGPPSLWDALCAAAATARDFSRLGDAAHDRGLYQYAVLLWTKAIIGGNLYAAGRLTSLLYRLDPDCAKQAARWAASRVVADDASGAARLLGGLRAAEAGDAIAVFAARAAEHVSLEDPAGAARLLEALRAAEAGDAIAVFAARAAEHVSLEDPAGAARLLETLRKAGACDAVTALLVRDPAGHASLGNPYGVARLLRTLREVSADDAVTALVARDPANHVSLEDPAGVARLLEALRAAGADSAVTALLARDPAGHASLGNPYGVARLLRTLREVSADDAVTALVSRTARNATIGDPSSVARLLETLREAGASDAVTALLARDPGAHASLEDPSGVARLLRTLREASADDAVSALASRTARNATIGDPSSVALLLTALREAGAGDAVITLLARDPAAHASLEDPFGVAQLLEALREEEASDAVATLLARDPAAHASLEDPSGVARLLRTLREAGASDAVTALLARDPAGHASLEDPFSTAQLLKTLREAGADDAVTALANRAVNDTSIDNPFGVASLLEALHEAEVRGAINALARRAANAGMFNLFVHASPDIASIYKLGQELSGQPSQYWKWKEPSSQDHNMQIQPGT